MTRRDSTTDEDFPAPDFPISPRDRDSKPPTPTRFSRDRGRSPSGERMDYEFRIVTMQRRIDVLEREIEDGTVRERQYVQQLEDELYSCRRVWFFIDFFDAKLNLCVAGRGTKCCDSGSSEGPSQRA